MNALPKTPKRPTTGVDLILSILRERAGPMTRKEIFDAAQAAGAFQNFSITSGCYQVSQLLYKLKKADKIRQSETDASTGTTGWALIGSDPANTPRQDPEPATPTRADPAPDKPQLGPEPPTRPAGTGAPSPTAQEGSTGDCSDPSDIETILQYRTPDGRIHDSLEEARLHWQIASQEALIDACLLESRINPKQFGLAKSHIKLWLRFASRPTP